MKSRICLCISFIVILASISQAYLIQGLDINIEYWAGSGQNQCVIVVDWNDTNGPYNSESHAFGYAWDTGSDDYVADALSAIDDGGVLDIAYDYDWGFVNDVFYDQTAIDGDNHTSAGYSGWWWIGSTIDAGQTWNSGGGIEYDVLANGTIWGLNIDEGSWTSASMTIPEPATIALLMAGVCFVRKRQ